MPLAPRIVHSDEILRIGTWQNVAIADVSGDLDLVRMKRLGRAYRELLPEFPKGICTFSVIRESTPIASDEARNEAARFIKELGDSCLRMAMVIEHRGLMAQVLRTIIRGLNVVTRNTKLVMFDEMKDAIDSIVPLVVPTQDGVNVAPELRAAVSSVCDGRGPGRAQKVAQR